MTAWVAGKIWQLRDGVEESDLLALIEEQIAPRYAELHPDVELGLLRLDGGRYLATQRWPDRATFEGVTGGPEYERWLQRYRPTLAVWDGCAAFVSEWAGEEIR